MRTFKALALISATIMAANVFAAGQSTTSAGYTDRGPKMYSIIPTAGITYNKLKGEDSPFKHDTGFQVGGLVDLGEGSTVFETGLLYTQLASKAEDSVVGIKVEAEFVANYITVPVQGKTYFSGGQDGAFIRYGASANWVQSAKITAKALGREVSEDVKDDMKTVDFQGVLGLGFTSNSPSASIMASLSFNRSLSTIAKDSDSKVYNEAFMLNVGIAL